jgi:hypothetical protein
MLITKKSMKNIEFDAQQSREILRSGALEREKI